MRDKIYAVLTTVVGVFLLVGGIVTLGDDSVKCGSQTMSAGDTCTETSRRGGSPTERSLEDQRGDNTKTGWLLLGGGVVMLGGGAFWTYTQFRKKRPAGPPPGQFPSAGPPSGAVAAVRSAAGISAARRLSAAGLPAAAAIPAAGITSSRSRRSDRRTTRLSNTATRLTNAMSEGITCNQR